MAGIKRKSGYSTTDNFTVSDDDGKSPASRTKRSKPSDTIVGSQFSVAAGPPKQDKDNNVYWEISKARRVVISDYKGKKMIAVREYYEKDGEWLPGKKGISMTLEQYAGLVSVLPGIENELRRSGIPDVPRPDYGSIDDSNGVVKEEQDGGSEGSGGDDDDARANHEATSDEEG